MQSHHLKEPIPKFFDENKYLNFVKTQGIDYALTALHHDLYLWEYEAFEGNGGWKPNFWRDLHWVREFSRSLWQVALEKEQFTRFA